MRPILLADGTMLTVRPINAGDGERLERMFTRLSPITIYRRFFSPIVRISPKLLESLTGVDHDRREALVAMRGDEIVAVARYDGRPGATEAEIAVTVEDAWQHRGIGKRLARRLSCVALDHGFDRFTATMLPDNRQAIGLLRRLSDDASVHFVDGNYSGVVPLSRAS